MYTSMSPNRAFNISNNLTISLLFFALLVPRILVRGQTTSAFTDPRTNITFQRFFGAGTSFAFGIALPQTPTTSFIGQLDFPLAVGGRGWGGVALTGDMVGPLLLCAWSDGTTVVSSFRQARNEDDNPPQVSGTFRVRSIAAGTVVNDTHMTFTFLCEGCLDASTGLTAAATAGNFEMGWALADTAVSDPASSAAILGFHNKGFNSFDAQLGQAKNAQFEVWAALAETPVAIDGTAAPISANLGDDDEEDDDDDDKEGNGGGDSDSEDDD